MTGAQVLIVLFSPWVAYALYALMSLAAEAITPDPLRDRAEGVRR